MWSRRNVSRARQPLNAFCSIHTKWKLSVQSNWNLNGVRSNPDYRKHSSLNNTFTASHEGRVTPISPSVGTRGSASSGFVTMSQWPSMSPGCAVFSSFQKYWIWRKIKNIDLVLKINRQQKALILFALKHRLDHCL